MCKDKFSVIVASRFQEIKRTFKTGLKNSGYVWNEDIFMDSYIKCDSVLKDKIMDEKEALKYFWTAYINKLKNHYKSRYAIMDVIPDDYDKIDEEYDKDKDILCELLYECIYKKFGKNIAEAWRDYRYYGKPSNIIIKEYGFDQDFRYILKRIKKHINDTLMKDKYMKELSNNILDQ